MLLVVNCGSHSLKYCLYDHDKVVKSDVLNDIGKNETAQDHRQAWEKLSQDLSSYHDIIDLISHRIIQGGEKYRQATKLNPMVLKDLAEYEKLIPLYMKPILAVIEMTMTSFPNIQQIGIFDTGFFKDLSAKVFTYPLPAALNQKYQLRRYGFYGINHQYAIRKAQENYGMIRTQKAISLYLGAGASIAAVQEGVCTDTSMGFTPLEGLMMMTRAGDLDNGLIIQLLRHGMSIDEVENILYTQSGLIGISGISQDMRDILFLAGYKVEDEGYKAPSTLAKNEASIKQARLAIEMYIYRIAKYIGAYTIALGGLDALIFTGPIGAGSTEIRNLITNYLHILHDYELIVVEPNEEEEMRLQIDEFLNI